MMNVENFRNTIAEQGGDTMLSSKGYLDVFFGADALRYKLDWAGNTWFIDEFQIPEDLNS